MGGWEESESQFPADTSQRLGEHTEINFSRQEGKRYEKISSVTVRQIKITMTRNQKGRAMGKFLTSSLPKAYLPMRTIRATFPDPPCEVLISTSCLEYLVFHEW